MNSVVRDIREKYVSPTVSGRAFREPKAAGEFFHFRFGCYYTQRVSYLLLSTSRNRHRNQHRL